MRQPLRHTSATRRYLFLKRVFDIAFSFVVSVVLVIPCVIIGFAIYVDDPAGSVLFKQRWVGKDGRMIEILKFRTMYADAHENPERYLNQDQLVQWRREQKVDKDPRVTRLGRVLRSTSLDELPQFLNVLKGDMSVVGPRPVTEEETLEFGDKRVFALSVRPGITGLWQVTDRNNATWENGKRQMLELYYVRHRGFKMDLWIMVRTFGAMFGKHRNGR